MNKSSHIQDATYDAVAQRLTIQFKNGRHYEFDGVPQALHAGLHAAPSPGTFFHGQIKPRFTGRLIKTNGQ